MVMSPRVQLIAPGAGQEGARLVVHGIRVKADKRVRRQGVTETLGCMGCRTNSFFW